MHVVGQIITSAIHYCATDVSVSVDDVSVDLLISLACIFIGLPMKSRKLERLLFIVSMTNHSDYVRNQSIIKTDL
jgi:hypothetical protein